MTIWSLLPSYANAVDSQDDAWNDWPISGGCILWFNHRRLPSRQWTRKTHQYPGRRRRIRFLEMDIDIRNAIDYWDLLDQAFSFSVHSAHPQPYEKENHIPYLHSYDDLGGHHFDPGNHLFAPMPTIQCRPFNAVYDPSVHGKCYSNHVVFGVAYGQGGELLKKTPVKAIANSQQLLVSSLTLSAPYCLSLFWRIFRWREKPRLLFRSLWVLVFCKHDLQPRFSFAG